MSHDLSSSPSLILAVGLFAMTAACVYFLFARQTSVSEPAVLHPRPYGEWTPVKFSYPHVSECLYPLEEIKPIPYRPFRYTYHTTMGIRQMSWDEWIELDSDYELYHCIRLDRIRTRGDKVVRVLEESPAVRSGLPAAFELVQELASYLSARYPTTFTITRSAGGKISTVTIVSLDETYDLEKMDPMKVVASLIQDDVAIMVEGKDGHYYFQAGAICLAGGWRLEDKIGLPLEEIHTSADVPHYGTKLHTSMERWFRMLSVDKPAIRNNYFVQVIPSTDEPQNLVDPREISWSTKTLGPEPTYPSSLSGGPDLVVNPTTICLRTERQTLRRLPISGAIIFTIRTYLTPIEKLGDEPGVPGRLASALRSWGEDVASYKGFDRYGSVALKYLDEKHEEQVEKGEQKVDNVYPM